MASFPASIKNFGPAHQDFTEVVIAAHVNNLQDEVVAVETIIGVAPHVGQNLTGSATTYSTLKARIDDIISGVRTHTHSGADGVKLTQANTHQSVDTDASTSALHHTLGGGANQAAPGNHTHGAGPDLSGYATVNGTQTLTHKDLTDPTNTFPSGIAVPAGAIFQFPGASAPAGYLVLDGSAVSRTTYATLFGILGITYGTGNGTTTFNLPDMRGRTAIGAGTGTGLTSRTLGSRAGEESHQLTPSEMPVHTHIQDAHYHTVNGSTSTYPGGIAHAFYFGADAGTGRGSNPDYGNGFDPLKLTTATNQNAGGDAAHNIMQPYVALTWIIKT